MRAWLIVIMIELCGAGMLQAQTTNCTVSGYLFKADGSPAADAQVNVISVVNNGLSFVLTPTVLNTDATGFTSFTAPRQSTVWVVGTALGLTGSGDVAILIPDADSATLDVLRQSAKPPVSGFNLTSGSSPTLALSLQDFGINLNAGPTPSPATVESFNGRSGAVTLTSSDISTALNFTPLDPGTVVGAVNASSAQIDDARLSSDVVRRNIVNMFSAQQTFSKGLQVSGSTQTMTATTDTDMMRFYRYSPPAGWELGSRINSQGAFLTNAWITVSGQGNALTPPSPDPYMLGIWSDVGGPSLQVRASTAPGSYLFSGLDKAGNYTFGVDANGSLQWGASTRATMDTNLYRATAGSLKTDGSLTIGNSLFLGASDAKLYRIGTSALRTNASMLVDGGLGVGSSNIAYPFFVKGSTASSWNKAARFEAAANVDGGGAIVEVGMPSLLFGARLYGGRWSSTNRGARLVGLNQLGQENAWLQVNGEGKSVAINTSGVDRVTVSATGNVGINTTPLADAVLDVNGGNTKGLRIAPRSVAGPPNTGNWNSGTIIVDSNAVVYICVTAGSPGTWQRLTPSVSLASSGELSILGGIAAQGSYKYQYAASPGLTNVAWASVVTTGDPAAADFNLAVASNPNPASPRNNLVTSWGYNNDGNGVRVTASEPTLNYRIESFYSPSAGAEYMESHLQYQSSSGNIRRPLAFQINRVTDAATVEVHGESFAYLGPEPTKQLYVKFMPSEVMFLNSTFLDSYTNNHQWLRQRNATGTGFINLAYLDSSNRIQLGGGTAAADVIVTGNNLTVGNSGGVKLTSAGGGGLALSTSTGSGAFLSGTELAAAPSLPSADGWKLFAKDDGTGKTQLCVQFSSGPPQCFAKQQ